MAFFRPLSLLLVSIWLVACSSDPVKQTSDGSFMLEGVDDRGYFISHKGRLRSYFLHLPQGYSPKQNYPLVMVLHSAMGNGGLIAERTGFNQLADKHGFIAVYPNGSGSDEGDLRMLTWNSGHCCYVARDQKIDDVGFITALLEHLQNEYAVDSRRIHLTGFSNGAMLAYKVGAELSHKVASIAAVSGNIGGREWPSAPLNLIPEPQHPLSVLVIHGLLDEQVAFSGGRGQKTIGTREDVSVPESVEFWRKHNGCEKVPLSSVIGQGAVIHDHYACGEGGVDVDLYVLKHGGHAWPGGENVKGWSLEKMVIQVLLDEPSNDLDATDTIWRFFHTHPKPSEKYVKSQDY